MPQFGLPLGQEPNPLPSPITWCLPLRYLAPTFPPTRYYCFIGLASAPCLQLWLSLLYPVCLGRYVPLITYTSSLPNVILTDFYYRLRSKSDPSGGGGSPPPKSPFDNSDSMDPPSPEAVAHGLTESFDSGFETSRCCPPPRWPLLLHSRLLPSHLR